MKLSINNFNISFGLKENAYIVNDGDELLLIGGDLINMIAGSSDLDDWDEPEYDDYSAICDLIENFKNQNREKQAYSMWFSWYENPTGKSGVFIGCLYGSEHYLAN